MSNNHISDTPVNNPDNDLLGMKSHAEMLANFISEIKITVIMVTHYLDEALIFADKIFILNEKQISHEVNIPFAKPRDQKIRFTEDFQNKKQELINLLN